MSNEIAEAAQFYLDVCEEHSRTFRLRNILPVTEGYRAAADKDAFTEAVREWLAADARRRFDEATNAIASEERFGGPAAATSEIEILEEATRLVREARKMKEPDRGDCAPRKKRTAEEGLDD